MEQPGLARDTRVPSQISDWPFELDTTDCQLLDRYVQLFSKTYPTCTGATNPFVRVFLPLSTRSRSVLDAMLALSCVQSWENGSFTVEVPMLRYRANAIRGCQDLVVKMMRTSNGQNELLWPSGTGDKNHRANTMESLASLHDDTSTELLAVCVLLMLYEKLIGERRENGTAHLQVFARIFPARLFPTVLARLAHESEATPQDDAILFLSNLFLYNDLVRSTSFRTSTLSNVYLCDGSGSQLTPPIEDPKNRFYFPRIIMRIGGKDRSVTDAEISAWNGRLDWLPSFALQTLERDGKRGRLPTADHEMVYNALFKNLECFTYPHEWDETTIISELYRVAATVYRKQCHRDSPDRGMGNLPFWATSLLRLLPPGSRYDTALLWPVAIIAKELTQRSERGFVLHRLQLLEQRLKLKNYCVVREYLLEIWRKRDSGGSCEDVPATLFG